MISPLELTNRICQQQIPWTNRRLKLIVVGRSGSETGLNLIKKKRKLILIFVNFVLIDQIPMQYQSPRLFTICVLCLKQNISYLGHAHHAIKQLPEVANKFFCNKRYH